MGISEEDDEEHDSEAGHVFSASAQGLSELGHGLVEACVLEDFHPRDEHGAGDGVVELHLPIAQELKVGELALVFEKIVEHFAHFELSENVERDAHVRDYQNDKIEQVPHRLEVLFAVMVNLDKYRNSNLK